MQQIQKTIYLNVLSQIRNEEFNDSVTIVPMSQWKQQRMSELKDEILSATTYSPDKIYQLSNTWQEKRRQKIFDDERHSIDTSIETLNLLNLIIYNKNEIETNGISITGLIELGQYLRHKGHRVDFVKLDRFISRLFMRRMASMIASMLMEIFGFEAAELPFLYNKHKNLTNRLLRQYAEPHNSGLIAQSTSMIVTSPLTVLSLWTHKAKSMLANIEE